MSSWEWVSYGESEFITKPSSSLSTLAFTFSAFQPWMTQHKAMLDAGAMFLNIPASKTRSQTKFCLFFLYFLFLFSLYFLQY
jgi:hypothetical protein